MFDLPAVTDATFDEKVLQAESPVLVDFAADWCGPCKALAPVVRDVACEYQGEVAVFTLDIDTNPETCKRYAIRSVPTLMLFKKGELANRLNGGNLSRSQLSAVFDAILEGDQ